MSTHAMPIDVPRTERRPSVLRAIKNRQLAEDVAFRLRCMTGEITRLVEKRGPYGLYHVERFDGSRWVKG